MQQMIIKKITVSIEDRKYTLSSQLTYISYKLESYKLTNYRLMKVQIETTANASVKVMIGCPQKRHLRSF